MVGLDASDALFDTAEETGGSKDAIVVSHTHTITDDGHSHAGVPAIEGSVNPGSTPNRLVNGTTNSSSATTGITVNSTGSSGTNANVQPFIVVRMWKRTA
jgi:hypothetical protein